MEGVEFLALTVEQLPVNEIFKLRCKLMGFGNLQEIVDTLPVVLLKSKGFTYDWLAELSLLLSGWGLLHQLQPPMESRSCQCV